MADQTTSGDNAKQPAVATDPAKPAVQAVPNESKPASDAKPAQETKPSVDETKPPAAETKPPEGETKPPKGETPPVEAKPTDQVPETYALKIGDQMVQEATVAAITPILKAKGFTATEAQALADSYAAAQKALLPIRIRDDLETVKKDPELGGLNFTRTQRRINDALAQFMTQPERDALSSMGLTNNPTLVRMFHRIGVAMEEAPQTDAGPQPREKQSTASKLYGGKDLVKSGPHVPAARTQ